MKTPITLAQELQTIVKNCQSRGRADTSGSRIAREAYRMGLTDGYRKEGVDRAKHDATIYRLALGGLGRMHRDAPPPCVVESDVYDLADAWTSLSNERRGEAIMVCLARQSEMHDPGTPPSWMAEYLVAEIAEYVR